VVAVPHGWGHNGTGGCHARSFGRAWPASAGDRFGIEWLPLHGCMGL